MRGSVEQRVVRLQGLGELLVRRECRRVGKQQLPRRLAFGRRPIGEPVLGDETRGDLRDPDAVLRGPRLAATALAAPGVTNPVPTHGFRQKSWSRMSLPDWPVGDRLSSRARGGNSL